MFLKVNPYIYSFECGNMGWMDEWMIFYMNKIKTKESKKPNVLKLRADKTEVLVLAPEKMPVLIKNNLCPQLFLLVYLI